MMKIILSLSEISIEGLCVISRESLEFTVCGDGRIGRRATKIKWLRKLYNMSDGGKFYEKRKC